LKRDFRLQLMGAVAVAILASACSEPQPRGFATDQPTRMCVDDRGMRQDESRCATRAGYVNPYYWYYVGRGGYVPPVGYAVRGGTRQPLAATNYQSAATAERAAIARGGFGASASRNTTVSRGGFGGSSRASAGG